MATVNKNDTLNKVNKLGQYFTPKHVVEFCVSKIDVENYFIIEPSCGKGIFLEEIKKRHPNAKIVGIEVDKNILECCTQNIICANFYDYNELPNDAILAGNPPFHSPAASLTNDPFYNRKDYVRGLAKKYNVTGIREEAVFFIIKSVDLILSNDKTGHIYYILPKTIFSNNSRSYKTFIQFLKDNVRLESVWDIGQEFDNVNTDLCYVHFVVDGSRSDEFIHNGEKKSINDFYGVNEGIITFHKIFKKTYLGSVPCESVLLSVRGETKEEFKQRLCKLMASDVTEDNLIELLSHNGVVHLMSLKKKDINKIKVVLSYVKEIKELVSDFGNDENYKTIQHRNELRYYFRHNVLKKASFVYQLNPNPTRSFYFPGNPGKNFSDYWGFADYDVNRNSCPSALRCVPTQNLEDNLTEEFKVYWKENTNGLPYFKVFDYLSYILKSEWYKMMKQKYQRFYFGIPIEFEKEFLNG